MAKSSIMFKGFDEMIAELDRMDKDIKGVVNECLEASRDVIAEELDKAMVNHKRTGQTAKAIIKDSVPEWEGTRATIKVGLNLPDGMAGQYLIYGTPKQEPARDVANAIDGSSTKRKMKKAQEEILKRELGV